MFDSYSRYYDLLYRDKRGHLHQAAFSPTRDYRGSLLNLARTGNMHQHFHPLDLLFMVLSVVPMVA